MFYEIFVSPQVKRRVILTYKHGIYVLSHQILKDLSKLGAIRKVSKPDSMTPQHPVPPPKRKLRQHFELPIQEPHQNFPRSALSHAKARSSLQYPVNNCPCKPPFDSNKPQTPTNLISLTILVTLRSFTLLYPMIRTVKL